MLISAAYREQNRQLHQSREDFGHRGALWAHAVARLVKEEGHASVLDYGCGKGKLAAALPDIAIAGYDPAIPGKDDPPEPADLVVCTDVLEHIERPALNAVLRDLKRCTKRKLFVNIATVPARKALPDGRNAHLIVKPAAWWREKLLRLFHIITWEPKDHTVFGELVPRIGEYPAGFKRPTKRRPMPRNMLDFFAHVRKEAAKYNDAFNRVETIRMWEGVDDERADMQCVANLLEDWPDPDEALEEICRYAVKAVMLSITLGDGRTPADWRKFLEQRLRVAEFYEINNQLLVVGSPTVIVQGIHAIGAVSPEDRWTQVSAAIARFPKRIETQPAHGRRVILACYGPSLGGLIDSIKREMEECPQADVVSVSGAHDFLLKHGIKPRFHVECDPRKHKADNIDAVCADTTYLLASCVHPEVFDKLGPAADVRLWHISSAEHTIRLVDELGEKVAHIISGGGSVGLRSIPLLYTMGYRDFSVYAMDCSFADDGQTQWAGRHFGKRQQVCQVQCGERIFFSSPTLLSYATNFWEMVQKVTDLQIRLYGDGLLQAMARYFQNAPQVGHVIAQEQEANV